MKEVDISLRDKSKFLKLISPKLGDCKWSTGFWYNKFDLCQESMVPYMESVLCGDIGHALNNFKIAAGLKMGEHKGMFWHDGDFYKWIEATLYVYAQTKEEALLTKINTYVNIIGKAQMPDGYLQTQVQLRPEVDRYENRKYHEMYNTGHLLITACVHFKVTGQRVFLDIAIKHADLLYIIFHPETKQFGRFGFNQTQIMGLVDLYRATNDQKYLDLAERFINRRGKYEVIHHPTTEGYPIGDMVQERTPFRETSEAVGHAVLALYFYAGAADVYSETGEQALIDALDRLWENVTTKKMYVTGAVGQTHYGASTSRDKIEEGFIDEYMMPNMTAYNETCANLCNGMFSYRMLGIKAESKYADIMELVLMNSGLSGISTDGKKYFYANPLRMIHNARDYHSHENATETANREPYLECFCCPPNLVRTIARVSEWAYSIGENGVFVNLYGSNKLHTQLLDGSDISMSQDTNYPWEGEINLTIDACKNSDFSLNLRIPSWAKDAKVAINGTPHEGKPTSGEYYVVNRSWKAGDVISIELPMEVQFVEGHSRIEEVRNQIAVQRGPFIYCVESPDLPPDTSILDVYINPKEETIVEYKDDFLGGIAVINTNLWIRQDKSNCLYQSVSAPVWKKYKSQLVPYFVWSNRGNAEMTVFMPVVWGQ